MWVPVFVIACDDDNNYNNIKCACFVLGNAAASAERKSDEKEGKTRLEKDDERTTPQD